MKSSKKRVLTEEEIDNERKNHSHGHGPMGGMLGGEKAKNFKKSIKELLFFIKPYSTVIFVAIILSIIGTVCAIFGPNILKKMTEHLIVGANNYIYGIADSVNIDFVYVSQIGIGLVFLYVISQIFAYLQGFLMAGVTAKITEKFRNEISYKINKLPLKYFDGNSIGDILSRATNDVNTIGNTLNQGLSSMISSITMIVGVLIMMLTISIKLTLIVVISVPVSLLLVILIVKLSQKHFKKHMKVMGEMNGVIEENYTNHNIVKAFNGEANALAEFEELNTQMYETSVKSHFLSSLMMPIINFVKNITYVIICIVGGAMALDKPVFIASILTFIQYTKQFTEPLANIASIANTLQSTAAASERVFEFLNEEEQILEINELKVLDKVEGKIEFKNVCFGYEPNNEIIHDFSFVASPGQKIAIVGPTGAGKTTLVNLLMRFYETNKGEILIDNVPIRSMKRENVRKMFGMVLQDTWLFEGTIKDNVRYGKPRATNDEIEKACIATNVHHLITTLPKGYDMIIDEKANLSQGERQLLTIARAMVQNSPMLILDEATSSVDTRTEELIQKAMDKLTKDRTCFVIAHRLSTIKNADNILVMKDGNIVEQGKHNQLLKKNGFYAELYNSQFSEKEC